MKNQVLLLCAHRPGRSPSQRYRFEQYLPYLRENGFEFTFSYLLDEKDDRVFYAQGKLFPKVIILFRSFLKRLRESKGFKNYDIIFIQRETHFLGTAIFEKLAFRSGAKVIFDFDDSIWLADTSPGNKKWEFVKKPAKFFTAIRHAHLIIAGNVYLAEQALKYNSNTMVIPTTIDTDLHRPLKKEKSDQIVIGWSGSISTIKHFNLLVPVLKELLAEFPGLLIRIIADRLYDHPEIPVDSRTWSAEKEVEFINSFDIGVMPLPDGEWSRGKCGLKGLSYMACEVPAVMSAVGINTEIIRHGGNGMLASSAEEWKSALRQLILNEELRKSLGKEGRRTVLEKYSVEANREKYLRAFKGSDF